MSSCNWNVGKFMAARAWLFLFLTLAVSDVPAEPPNLVTAARNFLAALGEDQKSAAQLTLDHPEREAWFYVPRDDRRGLAIGDMTPTQRYLAHGFLSQSLSSTGYTKTTTIMSLESILREIEIAAGRPNTNERRDPGKYHITVFGDPSEQQPWAWSFEGHHVSWNFAMVNGHVVASSPAFLGANPHEVETGPRAGLRILALEEDLGLALLRSLDSSQLEQAVIAEELTRDMVAGNIPRLEPGERKGLAASKMNSTQRAALRDLLMVYVNNVTGDAAAERVSQIEAAGLDLHFAWIGSPTGKGAQYYRVQAPAFLVEYINVQNNGNHVHSIWRDFDGDFGRDVLVEHLQAHPH